MLQIGGTDNRGRANRCGNCSLVHLRSLPERQIRREPKRFRRGPLAWSATEKITRKRRRPCASVAHEHDASPCSGGAQLLRGLSPWVTATTSRPLFLLLLVVLWTNLSLNDDIRLGSQRSVELVFITPFRVWSFRPWRGRGGGPTQIRFTAYTCPVFLAIGKTSLRHQLGV